MHHTTRRKQSGMTALGFIIMALVVGILLFAAMKLAPIYLENKRIGSVLGDIKAEMDGTNTTANRIRLSMLRRLDIEMIKLPAETVKISKSKNGYTIQVRYDNRTHYFGDLWLVVALDEKVEIIR
jgi:hypothetical protein